MSVRVSVSVCPIQALTFECIDLRTSFWYESKSSQHLGQVRVSRPKAKGQMKVTREQLNTHIHWKDNHVEDAVDYDIRQKRMLLQFVNPFTADPVTGLTHHF